MCDDFADVLLAPPLPLQRISGGIFLYGGETHARRGTLKGSPPTCIRFQTASVRPG